MPQIFTVPGMRDVLTLDDIESKLTTAIGQQETSGGTAGVGVSLNNPDAIKYAPWEGTYGATEAANGFAKFPSLAQGASAAKALIDKYIQSGLSLTSLIDTWSPPADGNTNNADRVSSLASTTQLDPSKSILSQIGTAPVAPTVSQVGDSISSTVTKAVTNAINSTASNMFSSAGFSWSRIASFVIGVALCIAGLMMFRQTQIVIENVVDKSKAAVKTAGTLAEIAA